MSDATGDEAASGERTTINKTAAKEMYCLSDKDLESLSPDEKRNPRNRHGATMKLYERAELEALAVEKYGSMDDVKAERHKRFQKRAQRAEQRQEAGGSPSAGGNKASSSQHELAAQDQETQEATGLPVWITERVLDCRSGKRPDLSDAPPSTSRQADGAGQAPEFVLYWLGTAMRGHENPALDVARATARKLQLPLVVATFLLYSHTFPTLRRFKYMLEGLQDTQQELRTQGQDLLIYVEGATEHEDLPHATSQARSPAQGRGWDALLRLASRAAVVITEDMPVPPDAQWLQDLKQQLPEEVPVWAVDTACVVPMRLLGKSYEKAWAYRSATQKLSRERINQMPYRNSQTDFKTLGIPEDKGERAGRQLHVPSDLGWQPLDLTHGDVDITSLLKGCSGVDQSVPGVDHQRGGSLAAYKRWSSWMQEGLNLYAARRNNAMNRDGVSRLSGYHQFGMISPFKIARDVHANHSNGAQKFADEYLVWREIAFNFCAFRWPELESLKALPSWAQKTLEKHSSDPRHEKSLPQLERGQTGDKLWDAAQQQLVDTGELHNNVRMTWGKALLPWVSSPEGALKMAVHLNHKFALDGCNPCSYSGILWCFGQFDAPKANESTPITGSLRTRDTSVLGKRIKADNYKDLEISPSPPKSRQKGISSFLKAK
ncbi:hypothetical protein WJX74_003996 [Apatococcus lobatus]|uniref:Photolyase/cryptochrome alpha/beta domain-containing protein n=1 Tax=Apatococcus lobatus TaxID=904363 RepID=A0AAW1SBE9_9CHLO